MDVKLQWKLLLPLSGVLLLLWIWSPIRRGHAVLAPVRMEGYTIVIDAGHGGEDGGAVSAAGTVESHINLAVAQRLHALLDFCGVDSVLLREDDRSLHDSSAQTLREKKVSDLHNRAAMVEKTKNALFISIHQNTYPGPGCRGTQTFFGRHPEGERLAQTIQSLVQTSLAPENRRVPAKIPSTVYLMNRITCPAVLVECGFLSNPAEDALLQTPEYQTKLAALLTAGILTYQETEGKSPV